MAKIEKRCKFKVVLKKDMRPGMMDMLEFALDGKYQFLGMIKIKER